MAPWTVRMVSNPLSSTTNEFDHDGHQIRRPRRPSGPHLEVPAGHYPPVTPPPPRLGSRRSHSRSKSNPSPSLFGAARRNISPRTELQRFDDAEDEEELHRVLSRPASPYKRSPRQTQSEDHVTRRCMTCGHTNSFPQSKRGFRCGKCTAINDLEPCRDTSLPQVPSQGLEMGSRFEGRGMCPTPRVVVHVR